MIPNFIFRAFRANEVRVHELNYLFWECTSRCNLRCRHCGSDCKAVSDRLDMPVEDFLKALDTIPRKEIRPGFIVVLTGGEPLLRPDIEDVGRQITRRGCFWGMVSNGYFYTREKQDRLVRAGMRALTISLDGMEASHDWMRGHKGSYAHAVNAIAAAASEPMLSFDVVTCVTRRNIGELQEIHDMLMQLGVRQWRLFTVIPIGRAKDDPEMHLDAGQTRELMDFIAAARSRKQSMNVTFSCEGYLGRYEQKVRATPYFCRAGINIASVLMDGTICACPNIDREAFGQGNIHEDSLWDVWNSGFAPFRDRSWARKGECRDCRVFDRCLGNGMHNWHGDCGSVLNCHYRKLQD